MYNDDQLELLFGNPFEDILQDAYDWHDKDEDICQKCHTRGDIIRTACICPKCGKVIWGC